ncbi:MAG: hypothetical protein R3F60_02970 [bacterium]
MSQAAAAARALEQITPGVRMGLVEACLPGPWAALAQASSDAADSAGS